MSSQLIFIEYLKNILKYYVALDYNDNVIFKYISLWNKSNRNLDVCFWKFQDKNM